jgi:diacylglycerol O-acyltransferase / wax synthase
MAFSLPLRRERPLWEMWIADRLADGRIGVVGKAHHCLVDGIAAVELASLLLDPDAEPPAADEGDGWRPHPAPGPLRRLASGAGDMVRRQAALASEPIRVARSPRRLFRFAEDARQAAAALAETFAPAPPDGVLNEPISPMRHLALVGRPLDELKRIKRRFGTTLNDVVLAACAGAVRGFLAERGEPPRSLKTMVPVNVRDGGDEDLGNRISFIFVELPCDEPDPVVRLMRLHRDTAARKAAGRPEAGDKVLQAISYAPRPVQQAMSHLAASPRAYNLVISNIPGPSEPLYMRGCRLRAAYPVVPLSDRHALSIGLTTIGDGAFFGLYADRQTLPDADELAGHLDRALDELLELAR